ncbi:hypothetical protein HS125_07255 [bacterium]|nr:hypothetical protein [bacterium]
MHRGFVAILASLALWNLGSCLIFLDRSSQTLHVLAFLGVLAAGPSALLFAAAFAERRLRGVTLGYWIASSPPFLILNPNNLTWRDGGITNLWRCYVLGYLVLFVGGALAYFSPACLPPKARCAAGIMPTCSSFLLGFARRTDEPQVWMCGFRRWGPLDRALVDPFGLRDSPAPPDRAAAGAAGDPGGTWRDWRWSSRWV